MPSTIEQQKQLVQFLGDGIVLIADSSSSSRPTLRKMMSNFGIKTNQVQISENWQSTLEQIQTGKVRILFCDYSQEGHSAIELFDEFKKITENLLKTLFLVISSDTSLLVTTAVSETDIDALIFRPLTYNDIETRLFDAFSKKFKPSPLAVSMEQGRQAEKKGSIPEALEIYRAAQKLNGTAGGAFSAEAALLEQSGKRDQALQILNRGLEVEKDNYKCLVMSFDLAMANRDWKHAQAVGKKIREKYSITPRRIPDLVRLCVLTEQFEEILNFHEIVSQIENLDESLSKYVSVGLVICGKFLIRRGRKEEALQALRKAETVSRSKPNILKEILVTLYQAQFEKEADDVRKVCPTEIAQSAEVKVAILDMLHQRGIHESTYAMANELIQQKVEHLRLFEIALIQARGLKRSEKSIAELVEQAESHFPQRVADIKKWSTAA